MTQPTLTQPTPHKVPNSLRDSGPQWWRYGHVWLVIAGPAVVVLASFITLYLAITRPDPVVDPDYYRKGVEINRTLAHQPANMAPAVQGRNHAATGVSGVRP